MAEDDWPLPKWIEGDSLAPFCCVSEETIDVALDVACVQSDDVLYDLGCGDGRICIAAAQRFGTRSIGMEIDEEVVKLALEKVRAAGVADKVTG